MAAARYLVSHLVHRWHNQLVPTPGRAELAHRGTGERQTIAEPLWQALTTVLATPRSEAEVLALLGEGAAATVRTLIEARFLVEPAHDFWSDFVPDLGGAPPELARDRLRWSRDVMDPHQLWMYPTWLGRPILQLPADLVLLQMLLAELRPAYLVETGRFRGGSTLFYASIFELLGAGHVVSVELRADPEVRAALTAHALARRITLLDGDSVAAAPAVSARIGGPGPHLVVLDSDHSAAHVRAELEAYAPLVVGHGKLVVCDTSLNLCPRFAGDDPHGAVRGFLAAHPEWRISPWAGAGFVTCAEDGILERLPEATPAPARAGV